MVGYKNQGMSDRAIAAYRRGERPWKQWKDVDILYVLWKRGYKNLSSLKNMGTENLRKKFLSPTCPHHVGKGYRLVDFYEVKINKEENKWKQNKK